MLESKPKESPVSSQAVDLFLRSGGVGVREMSTINTEGIKRLLDKCREQMGESSNQPFLKQQPFASEDGRKLGDKCRDQLGHRKQHLSLADWLKTPKLQLMLLGKNINLVAIACD